MALTENMGGHVYRTRKGDWDGSEEASSVCCMVLSTTLTCITSRSNGKRESLKIFGHQPGQRRMGMGMRGAESVD